MNSSKKCSGLFFALEKLQKEKDFGTKRVPDVT